MGAIAEAFAAFAQPLIDETDGSMEQLNKALSISQLCYNLALLPEDKRDEMVNGFQSSLKMDDEEFASFRESVIDPMVQRHQQMFPMLHRRYSSALSQSVPSPHALSRSTPSQSDYTSRVLPPTAARVEKHPGIDRYAPCPCNSGKKYKFCCGATRR